MADLQSRSAANRLGNGGKQAQPGFCARPGPKVVRATRQCPLALNSLTAPVVARDVVTKTGLKSLVYVGGSSNQLFAVDTDRNPRVASKVSSLYQIKRRSILFVSKLSKLLRQLLIASKT
jgi:hypothetical protein